MGSVGSSAVIPYMCFDYVIIYHSKMKVTEFNGKNSKNLGLSRERVNNTHS